LHSHLIAWTPFQHRACRNKSASTLFHRHASADGQEKDLRDIEEGVKVFSVCFAD
jgi:hypothetical protein